MHTSVSSRISVSEIVQLAALTAIMIATKEIMNLLPNIHLTTTFIILGAMLYGWKVLYAVFGFVVVQGLLYGFGSWFFMYLYSWPICAILAVLFRQSRSRFFWAAFAGLQGLTFGALCSITYLFIGGFQTMLAYWVAGIPFDLIHGASNAVVAFVLLMPLYQLVNKIRSQT